jgi:hypothetical protein
VQADFSNYFVGNSLSGQTGMPIPDLAASSGQPIAGAIHMLSGCGLATIEANPNVTSIPPSPVYGYFGTALPDFNWSAVTLEPYGEAFAPGRQAADYFIGLTHENPTNQSTKFFMLSVWPQGPDFSPNYDTSWNAPYDPATDDPSGRWSRQYSLAMLNAMRSDNPASSIAMVPSGEVLYQVNALAKQGKFTSIHSVADLYVDPYHLTSVGCYIAGMTWFDTAMKRSAEGLPLPASMNLSGLPPEDALLLQQTVWNVLTANASLTLVPEPGSVCAFLAMGLVVLGRRRYAA